MSKKKNEIKTNTIRYCWRQTMRHCRLVEPVSGERRKYLNGHEVHDIGYKCESKRNGCRGGLNLKKKPGMASGQI